MEYRILSTNTFELNGYVLLPYRHEDLLSIMEWRNAQMNILRQDSLLDREDQEKYYKNIISPTFDNTAPEMILFSILKDNKCIGYGGLTNINWRTKRAEISFLVDTRRSKDRIGYSQDFSSFLTLIKRVAFTELKLKELFTETYDIRPFHLSILEENGFIMTKRLKKHVEIMGKGVDSLIHEFRKEQYHV